MDHDNQPARKGWKKVNGKWEPVGTPQEQRYKLRTDVPERTVSQCKEAALKLLSAQLWTLEKEAELNGLTAFDEERILALLRGFNAALPKNAEETPLDLSKLTVEQLKAMGGK